MKKIDVQKLFASMKLSFDDFVNIHGDKNTYDFSVVGDFIEEILEEIDYCNKYELLVFDDIVVEK